MGVNYSAVIYLPNYDFWARDVTIMPVISQPGVGSFTARGIFNTRPVLMPTDMGMVVTADQQTILDVRDFELSAVPVQGDLVDIPADGAVPAEGMFQVVNTEANGGGETTLIIQKYTP